MNYRTARRLVRARDGYRCQECGRRPLDLAEIPSHGIYQRHIHHKLRLETHHIAGPTGKARYLPGRHQLPDNLVTLCGVCHRLAHGRRPYLLDEYLPLGLADAGPEKAAS